MLDALVRGSLQPLSPGEAQKLLRQVLAASICVPWIVQELSHLLIRHDVPDSVRCKDNPFGDQAALELVLLWVVGKG